MSLSTWVLQRKRGRPAEDPSAKEQLHDQMSRGVANLTHEIVQHMHAQSEGFKCVLLDMLHETCCVRKQHQVLPAYQSQHRCALGCW